MSLRLCPVCREYAELEEGPYALSFCTPCLETNFKACRAEGQRFEAAMNELRRVEARCPLCDEYDCANGECEDLVIPFDPHA